MSRLSKILFGFAFALAILSLFAGVLAIAGVLSFNTGVLVTSGLATVSLCFTAAATSTA